MSGLEGKPFAIPKQLVWQAWKSVKANGGAAGADGVTIEMFEKDLGNSLYKIWNRMSSGTYFPPPVRAVEIGFPLPAWRHPLKGEEFSDGRDTQEVRPGFPGGRGAAGS